MSTAVGVDGCKAGWFYFRREGQTITHGIVRRIHDLADTLPDGARVLIDIPIGLIDRGAAGRRCDREARKLLGAPRASSVFSAPCRAVLEARSYEDAKRLSLAAIGKMLSKQAFLITPKIREVDQFLRNRGAALVLREVHPEVCFWALNGRKAILVRKKDPAGFAQRLDLLSACVPDARALVADALNAYPRKEVARDDVLDALVALVVASTADADLASVPRIPESDSQGLPMEIVFTESPNDHAL